MTMPREHTDVMRVLRGLEHGSPAVRLRTALAAGAAPDPRFVDELVERCAVEPDFHVRDMLTWRSPATRRR
ncbi:HEAT repeat protein OS=Streptomyces griseomycini OX=66895 GN=FHS37_003749 PE=4 SV=1 [Streptomyces griseomycini]